jgi:hypothetical protein
MTAGARFVQALVNCSGLTKWGLDCVFKYSPYLSNVKTNLCLFSEGKYSICRKHALEGEQVVIRLLFYCGNYKDSLENSEEVLSRKNDMYNRPVRIRVV